MSAGTAGGAGGGAGVKVDPCTGQSGGQLPEAAAAAAIYLYVFPVFLLIGSIGNVLSAALMHRLSAQVWSTCLYLSVLAVVELLVLYVECGNRWYRAVAEDLSYHIMTSSNALCKVYLFLFQFIRDLAPWIVVSVAVETLVATRWPLRMYVVCTKERARAVLLFITVLLVCLAMQYFWTYGLYVWADPSYPEPIVSCSYIEEFSDTFRDVVWPFLSLAVGHVVPLVVVAGLLVVILWTAFRDQGSGTWTHRATLAKYFLDLQALGELRIAATLVTLFYAVVATLKMVLLVVNYLVEHKVIVIPHCSTASILAKLRLGHVLYETLLYAFLSMKIFVYLATCRRFRRDLVALLLHCRDSQGHPLCGALRCPLWCRSRGSAVTHTDPDPTPAMENPPTERDPDPLAQPPPLPKLHPQDGPRLGLPVSEERIREARKGLVHPKPRMGHPRTSLEEADVKPLTQQPLPSRSRGTSPLAPGLQGLGASRGRDDVKDTVVSLEDVPVEADPLAPYRYEHVASNPDVGIEAKGDSGKAIRSASARSPKKTPPADSKGHDEMKSGFNTDV